MRIKYALGIILGLFCLGANASQTEMVDTSIEKYTQLSQSVYNYFKGENKLPSRLYTLVDVAGRGFWDHRLKRGQPGKDGVIDREPAKFPVDIPRVMRLNLEKGTQVPTWAPNPKHLAIHGVTEVMVGNPDSMVAYPTFMPDWLGEEIIGTCPVAQDTELTLQRFGKGYAAVMYCSEWFLEWDEDSKYIGKEAIFDRRPITAYWGRPYRKVECVTAVLVMMVRPETQLGKYYDWMNYKPNGPYDYPLIFLVLNCDKSIVEILGFLTPDGDPIAIQR